MSDEMIIEYCSPTLARIKTGNLFTCNYDDKNQLMRDIRRVNEVLVKKGIRAIPVRYSDHRVLVYVFRNSFLVKDFCDKDTATLLRELGYKADDTMSCVRKLSEKLSSLTSSKDFPHEIGLFLGYPIEDVKGFIKYKGECSKCTGVWKVYGDVESAKAKFERYDRCTKDYKSRYKRGMTLSRLAVSA